MESDIVMNTHGVLAMLMFLVLTLLPATIIVALAAWKIETLEKQLAEARKKARRVGYLCKGLREIKAKLEEREWSL